MMQSRFLQLGAVAVWVLMAGCGKKQEWVVPRTDTQESTPSAPPATPSPADSIPADRSASQPEPSSPKPPAPGETSLPTAAVPSSDPKSGSATAEDPDRRIPLSGYVPDEVGFVDDAAFFASLDLGRAGLEKVRAAVEGRDFSRAVEALADYYRERTGTVILQDGKRLEPFQPAGTNTQRLERGSMAEQAMTREYLIAGIAHTFRGKIQWELNPTTQPGYKGPWSGQFHTQLNRMHHWRALAEAWRGTSNSAYLTELLAQMKDWNQSIRPPSIAQVPTHVNRYQNSGGNLREFKLWLPLDTGQRAANLVRVFETIRRAGTLTDRELVDVVKMAGEHARLLTQLEIGGNHLAIATSGLAHVAVAFPEFRDAPKWREEVVLRVGRELRRQVYPDGAQMELTPWYHYTTLRNFADIVELIRVNNHPVPDTMMPALEQMYLYTARITAPDGFAPPLNDSEYLRVTGERGVARRALDFFPGHPVFTALAREIPGSSDPGFLSLLVPYAGQAVMRSGWDPQALYLLMEYGPYGIGHMHDDKLGLIVSAYGRRLLVDPGRNKYEASLMRDFSVNASAHSTVLFNGLFQVRRLAEKQLNRVDQPVSVPWRTGPDYDYVVGSYGADPREVFGLPTDPPGKVAPQFERIVLDEGLRASRVQTPRRMVQHRHVVFIKPYYWVVVDTFDPLDRASHEYTSLFQLGEGEVQTNEQALLLGRPGEAGMVLVAAGTGLDGSACEAQSPVVVRGQEDPFVLGWHFENGEPRPAPTAVFRHRAAGVNARAYLIVPHKKGGDPAPAALVCDAPDGGRFRIRVEPGAGMPAATLEIPADGAAGTVKRDPAP